MGIETEQQEMASRVMEEGGETQGRSEPWSENVCTLYDGNYDIGVGALINSLSKSGFRGVVWVGYRGAPPFWFVASGSGCGGCPEMVIARNIVVRLVKIESQLYLPHYKPHFVFQVVNAYGRPNQFWYYFDADVVVKGKWASIAEWSRYGICVCEDIYSPLPARHPLRCQWKEMVAGMGGSYELHGDAYYNSGFVGCSFEDRELTERWAKIMDGMLMESTMKEFVFIRDRPSRVLDQDALNAALMMWHGPVSPIGKEAMDFIPGTLLSHAILEKPWQSNYIRRALGGMAPTRADKAFWASVAGPIPVFSRMRRISKAWDLRLGAAIGRFIRRQQ